MSFHSGCFLVARSVLQDPNFRQTVVLLLKHTAEGAFGLVVNRPGAVKGLPFTVYSGGPCPAQGLLMLHGHPDWIGVPTELPDRQIAPGIFLGDADCLKRANDADSDDDSLRYRVFTGYAGWGPGQLESELASGAWTVVRASGEVLFASPADAIWDQLAPPRIPQPSLN